jgi:hypothetical protein
LPIRAQIHLAHPIEKRKTEQERKQEMLKRIASSNSVGLVLVMVDDRLRG